RMDSSRKCGLRSTWNVSLLSSFRRVAMVCMDMGILRAKQRGLRYYEKPTIPARKPIARALPPQRPRFRLSSVRNGVALMLHRPLRCGCPRHTDSVFNAKKPPQRPQDSEGTWLDLILGKS